MGGNSHGILDPTLGPGLNLDARFRDIEMAEQTVAVKKQQLLKLLGQVDAEQQIAQPKSQTPVWDEIDSITAQMTQKEYEDIMADLDRVGISEEDRKKAYNNMMSDQLNNGITYSSPKDKRTVMVVAKAESAREYFNSFFHELKHFEEQIGEACNIDQKSEDAAYLRGNVAGMMFDCMAPLLCDCCRRKRHEGYDDEDDF